MGFFKKKTSKRYKINKILVIIISLSAPEMNIRKDGNYMVMYKGQTQNSCTQRLSY